MVFICLKEQIREAYISSVEKMVQAALEKVGSTGPSQLPPPPLPL